MNELPIKVKLKLWVFFSLKKKRREGGNGTIKEEEKKQVPFPLFGADAKLPQPGSGDDGPSPSPWALPAAVLTEIFWEQMPAKAHHQTMISIHLGFPDFPSKGPPLIL